MLVEHAPSLPQVGLIRTCHPPGNAGQPVEIIPRDAVLGRADFQRGEFAELILNALRGRGGHVALRDAGAEFLELGGTIVFRKPQFLLDVLELLAQHRLALTPLNLGFDVASDLHLRPRDLELSLQERDHFFHASL